MPPCQKIRNKTKKWWEKSLKIQKWVLWREKVCVSRCDWLNCAIQPRSCPSMSGCVHLGVQALVLIRIPQGLQINFLVEPAESPSCLVWLFSKSRMRLGLTIKLFLSTSVFLHEVLSCCHMPHQSFVVITIGIVVLWDGIISVAWMIFWMQPDES